MTKAEKLFRTLEEFKDDLTEYVNDEILDIMDVVPAEKFAVQVIKIAQRLVIFMEMQPLKVVPSIC